jgi:hypothetical protein
MFRGRMGWLGGAGLLSTLRAAVGKAGFVRFQFELFFADDADFDRKRHFDSLTILIMTVPI